MKLWQFLKNNMCKNAGQRVSEGAAQMTFEELIIFAESFSKNLKDMKCCAILCHSEMAAAMALLACFAAGVTAVPLSYRYGALHCKKIKYIKGKAGLQGQNLPAAVQKMSELLL